MATPEDERGDSSDPETSSSGDDGSDSEASEPQVEWLVTSRSKRSTAGNRMKSMLATEEADSDLELLFAEDGDDAGFTDLEKEDASDVQMDSSSDEEDRGGEAGADDLEGEKELEKEAKAKRLAQRKRKAQEAIPIKFRKKVRIEQPPAESRSPASSSAPPPHLPRPKKKSERTSWLPSAADMPTRASERHTTRLSKEQLHQQMVERELKRKKQMEMLEKKAKKLEAMKKPPMTQADRLAEAAIVEKRNSKSLNRWEEAEKQREEERLKKIAALHSRKLDGPVVTFWSGIQELEEGQMKHIGKMVSVEEKAPRKKRQSAVAATAAPPAEAGDTTRPDGKPDEKPRGMESSLNKPKDDAADKTASSNATISEEGVPTATSAPSEKPDPGPAVPTSSTPPAPPPAPAPASESLEREAPATPDPPPTAPNSSQPLTLTPSQPPGHLAAPTQQSSLQPPRSPMAPPPIPPPPDAKPGASSVLAAPVLAPPLGVAPTATGFFPSSGTKSSVLAAPNTTPAPSPPPPRHASPSPSARAAPPPETEKSESAPVPAQTEHQGPSPDKDKKPAKASEAYLEASHSGPEPPLEGKVTKNCIILQNFDEMAIKDKQVQTQILFGRKMNKLAKPGHAPLCAITNHAARYRDPKTGLPYYNSYAFREIQRLHRGDYRWSRLVGAWMGSGTFAARGVPERFLDPSKESPNAKKPEVSKGEGGGEGEGGEDKENKGEEKGTKGEGEKVGEKVDDLPNTSSSSPHQAKDILADRQQPSSPQQVQPQQGPRQVLQEEKQLQPHQHHQQQQQQQQQQPLQGHGDGDQKGNPNAPLPPLSAEQPVAT